MLFVIEIPEVRYWYGNAGVLKNWAIFSVQHSLVPFQGLGFGSLSWFVMVSIWLLNCFLKKTVGTLVQLMIWHFWINWFRCVLLFCFMYILLVLALKDCFRLVALRIWNNCIRFELILFLYGNCYAYHRRNTGIMWSYASNFFVLQSFLEGGYFMKEDSAWVLPYNDSKGVFQIGFYVFISLLLMKAIHVELSAIIGSLL